MDEMTRHCPSSPPLPLAPSASATRDASIQRAVYLTGNVGADPEFRTFESGRCRANFSIALRSSRSGGDTEWFQIEVWNELAQAVKDEIRKGTAVCILGSLRKNSWMDRNGDIPSTSLSLDTLTHLSLSACQPIEYITYSFFTSPPPPLSLLLPFLPSPPFPY